MRARPGNLCMAEAVPFGQKWTYHTDRPLDMVLRDGYFLAERYKFRVGDELRLCQIVEGRVRELLDVIVVEAEATAFEIKPLAERQAFPDNRKRLPAVTEPPGGERYIGGNGIVNWNVGRRMYEVLEGDEIVAATPDKELARAMATGSAPLPEAKAAA